MFKIVCIYEHNVQTFRVICVLKIVLLDRLNKSLIDQGDRSINDLRALMLKILGTRSIEYWVNQSTLLDRSNLDRTSIEFDRVLSG